MSKVKVLGIVEKQGTFEGKPYHSIKFHIAEPFTTKDSYGMETSVQSVKFDNLPFVLERPMRMDELVTYVGSEADFCYDKNGNVTSIKFLSDQYEPASSKK